MHRTQLPPSPPRIPTLRRIRRKLAQAWPLVVWCGAIAVAIWLYTGRTDPGQAQAHEEIREVRAVPSVAGRIAALSVELGDEVAQGDVIATLDARDLDARLVFARAKLERSRTRIASVRAELEADARDRLAQASARRSTHEAEGRRIRASIDGLTAQGTSDRAELGALTPQITRLSALAADSLVTVDRLDELVGSRSVLEARIASHEEQIRSARDELDRWEDLAPASIVATDIQTRLVPFELELETQEARVAELELERGRYAVLAPSDGVVNRISARTGEWCDVGAEIALLVVTVPHRVTAFVLGQHVRGVEPGTSASLHPRDRVASPLDGRVLAVGARMELVPRQLRTFPSVPEWGRRVSIAITNPAAPLPGEVYTVRFR